MSAGSRLAQLRALLGTARSQVALALALIVTTSLLEGVGLLTLVPLLDLVGLGAPQQGTGRLAGLLASGFAAVGLRPTLEAVLGLFLAVFLANALLFRWQALAVGAAQQAVAGKLRARLYRAILGAHWLFLARLRAADLTHALTTEADRVGIGIESLLLMLADGIVAAIYTLVALQLSPALTGVVLACGAGLLLLLHRNTEEARQAGESLSTAGSDFHAAAAEHLASLKITKSYGAEARSQELFLLLAERLGTAHLATQRVWAAGKLRYDAGAMVFLCILLYVAVAVLQLPATGALLLLFIFSRIMPRLAGALQSYHYVASMLPAWAAIERLQAGCSTAAEGAREGAPAPPLRAAIRLHGVTFAYESAGGRPAIEDVDLEVRAGETTAVVGPSGGGKTTVADLIMGLIRPDRGQILVDGRPLLPEQLQAWRERIGYVAQDAFLFHDTIRANLLWARPDATEAEAEQALRWAAADFVAELPRGMDTVIGDRGTRLSGGERQRLALARALLRRPALLILDEATSALDSENERRIQQAIEHLHGQVTMLVITHRLATIRGADAIHLLERGRLVESGRWEELLARDGGRLRALSRTHSFGDV